MKQYSHENWNQLLASPSCAGKEADLRLIGIMAKGNLQWFIRQCIATEEDLQLMLDNPSWNWRLIEPTQFTKRRRKMEHEDTIC